MQFKIIIQRILSNIIDIVIFISGYLILSFLSNIETGFSTTPYLLFFTYIFCFGLPIVFLGNTIGKLVCNVKWENSNKLLISTKYFLYFLFFFPGFSFVSVVTNFPYFKINDYEIALKLQLFTTMVILDFVVFILSLGRYHVLDYIINLQLKNLNYKKKYLKSLSIILLFWSILIFTNLWFLKIDLSVKKINNSISGDVYFENYPVDLFYGSNPFIIKKKSNSVFITDDMFSFLFNKNYDQKTIFLNLPYDIFNSKSDRYNVCKNLILHSIKNDVFQQYEPKQTKIILRTFKKGKFLQYYTYNYTYYFNNKNNGWGIYGGIKNDSLTVDKYSKFVTEVKKQNTGHQKIKLNSKLNCDNYIISSNGNKLQFQKISFNDTQMHGTMQLNFPPNDIAFLSKYWDILGSELPDLDEDLFYLKLARDEISAKDL